MTIRKISVFAVASFFLSFGIAARAATFTGAVINKTTNKPSPGDTVVLVDVQAGMSEAATATTDSSGRFSLDAPGMGPYLIRVTHQGGSYFIAAPQGGTPGNVTVYDVAAKVDGVSIDADMFLLEAAGGTLRVHERFLVRNSSLPPRAQFSNNTFEIVLPADAELDGASATRPGGLATNTHLLPLSNKGHYTFNVPIQPDQDEKETLFEVQYHLSYNGSYTFNPQVLMPADNLVVYAAKGIDFQPASGSSFQPAQEDPRVQTYITHNVHPGQKIAFSISGEGQMPRDAQNSAMPPQGGMGDSGGGSDGVGSGPGGGIGAPIGSPDPLTKYKWWILALLAITLVAAAAFLLRKRTEATAGGVAVIHDSDIDERILATSPPPRPAAAPASRAPAPVAAPHVAPVSSNDALLNLIKEEMFAVEREKLSGALPLDEYASIKSGLESLLRRILKAQ